MLLQAMLQIHKNWTYAHGPGSKITVQMMPCWVYRHKTYVPVHG